MIQQIKTLILLFFFVFVGTVIKSQDTITKPLAQISLLTIAPGTELYSLFGHTAVRVRNEITREDNTYNYGTFDFETPNFMVKFLRGKLLYQLSKAPFDVFLYEYNQTKRSVSEQVLDITQEETDRIIEFLENNALPENKSYLYDFLYDNCSTRVRDIFNKELNLRIEEDFIEEKSFRTEIHEYLESYPWTRFGIDLIVASRADKITDFQSQMFLPDYLQAHMAKSVHGEGVNKKFAFMPVRQLLFFDSSEDTKGFFTPLNSFLALSVVLILLYFTRFTSFCYSIITLVFILLGVGSMILIFMWFGTDHFSTKYNYNILWMNPLYLLLPFIPKKANITISTFILILTLLCLFNLFPQVMPVLDILPAIISIIGLNIYYHFKDANSGKSLLE